MSKTIRVQVSMTEDELEKIDEAARLSFMSRSAFIRKMTLEMADIMSPDVLRKTVFAIAAQKEADLNEKELERHLRGSEGVKNAR
jgi:metal-responsive CopG/Arc/MetJ family transcriptional regulator